MSFLKGGQAILLLIPMHMRGPEIVYENIIIKAICDMINNNIPPNTTHRRTITTQLLFCSVGIQFQYDRQYTAG